MRNQSSFDDDTILRDVQTEFDEFLSLANFTDAIQEENSTQFQNGSSSSSSSSLAEIVFVAALMGTCIFITAVGNMLVVISVLIYPPLNCPHNHFLLSLACTDLAVATLVMPFHVVSFVTGDRWPLGSALCHAWLTTDILTCTASILHLCAVAADRYTAVHDPIRYALTRSWKRTLVRALAVWTASVVISVPPLIGWNNDPKGSPLYDGTALTCKLTDNKGFVVYSALGSFFIPLTLMTFLYAKIFLATRARLRARVRAAAPSSTRETNTVASTIQDRATYRAVAAELATNNCIASSETTDREKTKAEEGNSTDHHPNRNPTTRSDSQLEHHRRELDVQKLQRGNANDANDNGSRETFPFSVISKRKVSKTASTGERETSTRVTESRYRSTMLRERRAARTATVVIGAFVACWLPFFVVYLVFPFCESCAESTSDGFVRFVVWLGYVNSCLNPIIYTIFSVDFRRAFKSVILCSCHRRN